MLFLVLTMHGVVPELLQCLAGNGGNLAFPGMLATVLHFQTLEHSEWLLLTYIITSTLTVLNPKTVV